MFHEVDIVVAKTTGVPMPGVIIRAYLSSDSTLAPLYADENGTPIETVSALANAAVTNDDGIYDFWIDDGEYDVKYYVGDALLLSVRKISLDRSATAASVNLKANAAALGVAGSAANMGAFTGSTIPDLQTAKQALQALETAFENGPPSGSVTAETISDDAGEQSDIFNKVAVEFLERLVSPDSGSDGAGLVGLDQTLVYPENSLGSKLTRTLSAKDGPFNAKGDGSTNDLAALNEWASYAGTGTELILPTSGDYHISAALDPVITNDIKISGPGVIKYVGASTSPGDLLTIGDGVTTYDNVHIMGPRFDSNTVLTAGSALRIRKCRNVHVDISIDGEADGDVSNCFDGVWLDSGILIHLHHSRFTAKNASVKCNDIIGLHMNNAFTRGHGTDSTNGIGIGLHLMGGCADVNTEDWSQLLNETGVRVDNALSAAPNQQIFFNEGTKLDSNQTHGILLSDATATTISKLIKIDCWIASSGGVGGAGLVVTGDGWKDGRIDIGSARFIGHVANGIYSDDVSVALSAGPAAVISDNVGYGIAAGAAWVVNCLAKMNNNGSGNFLAGVTNRPRLAASYPTYANDGAAGTGGLTAGDLYKTSGGVMMVKL